VASCQVDDQYAMNIGEGVRQKHQTAARLARYRRHRGFDFAAIADRRLDQLCAK
jgi:acetolactate synthase regulatory subunit